MSLLWQINLQAFRKKKIFLAFFSTFKRIKGHSTRPDSLNSKIKMLQFTDMHFYLVIIFIYKNCYCLLSQLSLTHDFFSQFCILQKNFQLTAEAKTWATKDFGFFTGFKLASLSKSIEETAHLETQSVVKVVQKYVCVSKTGFQITHKVATCEHTCWRNAHLGLAGYPPVDAGLSLHAGTHAPHNPRGQLSQGEIEREIG